MFKKGLKASFPVVCCHQTTQGGPVVSIFTVMSSHLYPQGGSVTYCEHNVGLLLLRKRITACLQMNLRLATFRFHCAYELNSPSFASLLFSANLQRNISRNTVWLTCLCCCCCLDLLLIQQRLFFFFRETPQTARFKKTRTQGKQNSKVC